MRTLVIGAGGYIGGAVAAELAARGHTIVGLARTAAARDSLRARGYEVVDGDLAHPASLAAAMVEVGPEAVVHAGSPAGERAEGAAEADPAAVDIAGIAALTLPLEGTGAPLIYTSGIWWLGASGVGPITEDVRTGTGPTAARPRVEGAVLAAAQSGVRAMVIRPGIVHGHGGGVPADLVTWAREHGIGRYVGTPGVRWPTVHVDDLAVLYALALERGEPGAVLHGVAEEAVEVATIAAAADRAAGGAGSARAWPVAKAATRIGTTYARSLALDQAISSAHTRRVLGWRPVRPSILADLTAGSYAG